MPSMSKTVPRQVVAVGSVSSIHTFGSDHVLKRCPSRSNEFAQQAFDVEVRAYERLGNHPRITVLSDVTNSDGPWRFLRYIHSKGIIHVDVGCHNLLLDQSGHIRFIDFAGSGIDDEPPLVCYEWCASRGDSAPTKKTDMFAFGSTLFEIESSHVPYHELYETMEIFQALRAAEQRFTMREYPGMENFLFRHVITQCWDGAYSCMSEVEQDLRSLRVADDDDDHLLSGKLHADYL
ncbi:putative serine-threonine protein kinase [Aspergillus carlsbadensis]|nr:putative serine-threonine protein kinase [Aspergillus carlsbadensis]